MKLPLFAVWLLASCSAFAQYAKGSFNIGADLDMGYNRYIGYQPYQEVTTGISGMYFVSDRTALGLRLSEAFGTNSFKPSQTYGVALLTKHYRGTGKRAGLVFAVPLSYLYGENDGKITSSSVAQFSTTTTLSGAAGLYCFIFPSIALEASFSIFSLSYTDEWNDRGYKKKYSAREGHLFTMQLHSPDPFKLSDKQLNFSIVYYLRRK